MISNKNILVFVHIPKTAGVSINICLQKKFKNRLEDVKKLYPNADLPKDPKSWFNLNYVYIGHWKYASGIWPENLEYYIHNQYSNTWIKSLEGNSNLNFIPFTVSRCPYLRFVSAFNYYYSFNKNRNIFFNLDLLFKDCFNEKKTTQENFYKFIEILNENWLDIYKYNFVHLKPMKDFVFFDNKILVKEILNFENINEEINILLNKYNFTNVKLPYINNSIFNINHSKYFNESPYHKDLIYNMYKEDFELFKYKK